MTLVVDNESVVKVLKAGQVNDVLEQVHASLSRGTAVNAPPYRVFTPRNSSDYVDSPADEHVVTHHAYTSLTGAVADLNVVCDRVDSDIITYVNSSSGLREVRLPGTPDKKFCGLIYVYDSQTGALRGIVHDGFLQKYRVAGTGAVAAKYLAKPNASVLGLIGSGWQASAAVECFAAVGLREIRVFSPSPAHRESFAAGFSGLADCTVTAVDTAEACCDGADVVYTATNSPEPVLARSLVQPGQFVTGVKDVEAELGVWESCDFLCVNRQGPMWERHAIGGVEVIPEHGRDYWGQTSSIEWDTLPLLGDVITGKVAGRSGDSDITGMFLRGDGVQFAAVAVLMLRLCEEQGLGTELDTNLFLQDSKYIP